MTSGHAAEHPHDDGPRFGGLHVPQPEFADDDGSADPDLAAALAHRAAGSGSVANVVAALHGRRLMVPLMAVLDSLDEPSAAQPAGPGEKDSHMATVSLVGSDGRRGLLAFTSVAAMAGWGPAARGIPASAQRVAASALDEGADAVLLDVAGPNPFALEGPALRAVAAGADWTPAWEDPEVRAAVAAALDGVAGLAGHRLVPGQAPAGEPVPDLLVLLLVEAPDVGGVAQAAADALAVDPVLARRCPGGVGLALG